MLPCKIIRLESATRHLATGDPGQLMKSDTQKQPIRYQGISCMHFWPWGLDQKSLSQRYLTNQKISHQPFPRLWSHIPRIFLIPLPPWVTAQSLNHLPICLTQIKMKNVSIWRICTRTSTWILPKYWQPRGSRYIFGHLIGSSFTWSSWCWCLKPPQWWKRNCPEYHRRFRSAAGCTRPWKCYRTRPGCSTRVLEDTNRLGIH